MYLSFFGLLPAPNSLLAYVELLSWIAITLTYTYVTVAFRNRARRFNPYAHLTLLSLELMTIILVFGFLGIYLFAILLALSFKSISRPSSGNASRLPESGV